MSGKKDDSKPRKEKIPLTVDPYSPRFDPRTGFNPSRNQVRDYCKLQGVAHPGDLLSSIPRSLDTRLISVENSSCRHVGIAITVNMFEIPPILMILKPLETRYLGVNPIGEADQFIHILNPITGEPVGDPQIIARDSNCFVLRDGENKWFIQLFFRLMYKASG